ncbi:hypothetical protein DL767_007570 [Monosporascus sp. MG133]|nr:hypothetical protein DL767_007570 [Monosporascus sp. MG133]
MVSVTEKALEDPGSVNLDREFDEIERGYLALWMSEGELRPPKVTVSNITFPLPWAEETERKRLETILHEKKMSWTDVHDLAQARLEDMKEYTRAKRSTVERKPSLVDSKNDK